MKKVLKHTCHSFGWIRILCTLKSGTFCAKESARSSDLAKYGQSAAPVMISTRNYINKSCMVYMHFLIFIFNLKK